MKITKIETKRLKAPLHTPFITSLRHVKALEDMVVLIHSDDGTIGYGEGAGTPVITGETLGSICATIEYIAPHLIGKEIDDFETLLTTIHSLILNNTTAKSALEMALYDLKSKHENVPLFQMLGGRKKTFRTDITISLNSINKMIADTQKALLLGYDTLKIKLGENPKKDMERMLAIHQSIGKDVQLRLDVNQAWTPKESVAFLLALEKKGIIAQCIEQPILADDFKGLKYIKERVQTPLLADESVFSLKDAKRLLQMQAVDYINIKLAKTAGISQALKLADLCKSYEVKCMIGCMLEGPIAIAAAVHVASAKADTITMLDLDAVSLLSSHPVKTSIEFNESHIQLDETAGLGVTY